MSSGEKKEGKKKETPTVTPMSPPGEEGRPQASEAALKMVANIRTHQDAYKKRLDDLRKMIREGHTVEGWILEEIKVPPIKGKKEKQAIKLILELFTKNPELARALNREEGQDLEPTEILNLILGALMKAVELLEEMAALFVEKDRDWVQDNLMVPDMVKVISPFLTAEAEGFVDMIKTFKEAGMMGTIGAILPMISK